jgi:hypothetical protein
MLVLVDEATQALETRHGMEVEAEDDVGMTHCLLGTSLTIALIYNHAIYGWHEVEVVGVAVGHHAGDMMTMTL